MKLARMATVYFTAPYKGLCQWRLTVDSVTVECVRAWDLGHETRLFLVAEVSLPRRPDLRVDRSIILPEDVRRSTEAAMETIVNLISIGENRGRRISSPLPCVALVPESDDERTWLDTTAGIPRQFGSFPSGYSRIDLDLLLRHTADRRDGVTLLSEALAHGHPTGRFHELVRLFERAFRCATKDLVAPLADYLAGAGLGYTQDEIHRWIIEIRHPATHADKRPDFVLESGIRPFLSRMEQAAFDVLLNKESWRSSCTKRRDVWKPSAGTPATGTDIFIRQGHDVTLEYAVVDEFNAYPLDLSACQNGLHPRMWYKAFEKADPAQPPTPQP